MKQICLLDLNYTLVANQASTRLIRPFSARLEKERYRPDLLELIKRDYVILITARPDIHAAETLANIKLKTGWEPDEAYFSDMDRSPATVKESLLRRFIFPKHGYDGALYYAWESNPMTRAMYARHGIVAQPYTKKAVTAALAPPWPDLFD